MYEEFQVWAVARGKLAPATIKYNSGRLRFMEKNGVDWGKFMAEPLAARRLGDAFLGARGMSGASRHALRTYEKALNLAARFAAYQRSELIWPRWELSKEPLSEGKTLTDDQLGLVMAYSHPEAVTQARRRAMIWLAFWLRVRRSEIARLRLRDLDAATRRIWIEYPAKGGRKRWKPVPGNAWHPNGAVQTWLRHRPEVIGSDALWTGKVWRRAYTLTVDAVGMEFQRMGQELGFGLSFVRTRRAGSQLLQRHKVRTRIIKADLSHSSEAVTETYLAQEGADAIEEEFELRRVPGFINRSRGHSGSRAVPPGDFRGSQSGDQQGAGP